MSFLQAWSTKSVSKSWDWKTCILPSPCQWSYPYKHRSSKLETRSAKMVPWSENSAKRTFYTSLLIPGHSLQAPPRINPYRSICSPSIGPGHWSSSSVFPSLELRSHWPWIWSRHWHGVHVWWRSAHCRVLNHFPGKRKRLADRFHLLEEPLLALILYLHTRVEGCRGDRILELAEVVLEWGSSVAFGGEYCDEVY